MEQPLLIGERPDWDRKRRLCNMLIAVQRQIVEAQELEERILSELKEIEREEAKRQ